MSRRRNGLSREQLEWIQVSIGVVILLALFFAIFGGSLELFGPHTDDGTPVVIEEGP